MYVNDQLKVPEEGEWYALTRVTSDGTVTRVGYYSTPEVCRTVLAGSRVWNGLRDVWRRAAKETAPYRDDWGMVSSSELELAADAAVRVVLDHLRVVDAEHYATGGRSAVMEIEYLLMKLGDG